ncbi:MAG: hypothetical protein ACK5IB_04515 [Qingshengfaniella sp.]
MTRIEKILETEKALLLAGRFEGLAGLADEKQALIAGFRPDGSAQAARILAKARHNDSLFAAALSGLREAGQRLAETRSAAENRTYGPDGALHSRSGPGRVHRF